MSETDGRKRVVITDIQPQLDHGKYPARTVIHEPIVISANIFTDGHDVVNASVLIKHEKEKKWREIPLDFVMNEHWKILFLPGETGFYRFKIQGWIDHFLTWKRGLIKKIDAGVDISVDLLIGAELLDEVAQEANSKDKKQLQKWSDMLRTEEQEGIREALVTSKELAETVERVGPRPFVAISDEEYLIEVERRKALFSTWYELFPRSASEIPGQHGTFKDVERLLPRIAEMGFDTLYFPPIHPIGEKHRKGKNNSLTAEEGDPGSPWAIGNKSGGHKDIHPELGTLEDFQGLIFAAKEHDIDIAMDIAFQCAPDHPYVKEHHKWFIWRPDGSVQYAENPPKKYEDILPINFESDDWQNLWKELKSVVEYWIEQGVEIFRVDNPHTKAFPFWEWMIAEVKSQYPKTIFLAEAFTRPRLMEQLAKIGFTQSYTYFTWRTTKYELEQYLKELTQTNLQYYFKPNFWPNTPDILPPHLSAGGENAHVQRLILAATMSASYGIYGPVYEFAINSPHPKKEEYINNEKYEIKHWDWSKKTRITDIITKVNRIRKENRALQSTGNIQFAGSDNDHIIAYAKQDKVTDNTILTIVNLDPHHTQSTFVRVPIDQLGIERGKPYEVIDLLGGGRFNWQDESNFVMLNPHEIPAHIFKIEQQ